ncbi:hypothetical protein A2839_01345 [Candidatus Uhrbacteria bacterium RIFCSPHIGHO2_01_FULL_47_10]|nr:MAG: hypothetical protein A2839_01345 [Candidatus Uhrbacteria bacterium RIFCSPHIGHO2_01_FULL_47_10]
MQTCNTVPSNTKGKTMKKFLACLIILVGLVWICSKTPTASAGSHVHDVAKTEKVTLRDLLFHHPTRAVAETFAPKVASGEVALMEGKVPGASGAFMLWPAEKLSPSHAGATGWKSVFFIDPMIIEDATQLVRNQLVIFHEYIHYRQAMSGKIAPETFYPMYLKEHPDQRAYICEQKWYAEVEAYQKECELAGLMKTSAADQFCKDFGTPKFERSLTQLMMLHDPSVQLCQNVFAKLGLKAAQ